MAKGYLYDNGDELITREDVNEVPDSSSAHAGDVLGLDSNKKPKWTTPESGLPDTSEASVGDVLTLDSDKDPVWSAPSGGGFTILAIDELPSSVSVDGVTGSYYYLRKNGTQDKVLGSDIFSSLNYAIFVEEGPLKFITYPILSKENGGQFVNPGSPDDYFIDVWFEDDTGYAVSETSGIIEDNQ